jgi:hypothetical protein
VPGTPHHALGDPRLTVIATTVLAVVVVGSLVVVESRFVNRDRYAAVGGLAYALGYLVLWALVPTMFWHFAVNPMGEPFLFAGIVGFGLLVLFVQGALPLYLYSRWSLRLPVVGLFVVSWVCGYLFFRVGGESGATFTLFLWSAMLAPVGIVAIGGLGTVERKLRRIAGP